jgi:hypothetical protein
MIELFRLTIRENAFNYQLMELKVERMRMQSLLQTWKERAKIKEVKEEHQIFGIKKLAQIFTSFTRKMQRNFITTLKTQSERWKTIIMKMQSLFMKKQLKGVIVISL